MGMLDEVRLFPKVIKTFENWWVYYLDIFKFGDNVKIYRLRDEDLILLSRSYALDVRIIKEVYVYNVYNTLNINEEDIVVDIGAHIGSFSIMSGLKTGNTGKVYAFEPIPETFRILKKNIYYNSLQEIVYPYRYAISNTKKKEKMYIFKSSNKSLLFHSSSFYKQQTETIDATIEEKIEVECITLRDIFDLGELDRIDVVKMDCEGEEYSIIFDTPAGYLMRIGKLFIEYHDMLSQKYTHKDLIDYLLKLKFNVVHEMPKYSERGCGIIYAWREDE